jgi:hypothetical protein
MKVTAAVKCGGTRSAATCNANVCPPPDQPFGLHKNNTVVYMCESLLSRLAPSVNPSSIIHYNYDFVVAIKYDIPRTL